MRLILVMQNLLPAMAIVCSASAASAAPIQYVRINTDFGDPPISNQELTDPAFAELEGVATEATQVTVFPPPDQATSVGSSVVMARAQPGSVGASVYNGYTLGTDTYYGYATARTEDDVMITGGPPNQTVTVAVGAIVNGGLGIYGSDAAADARAYFQFQGHNGFTGDTRIFDDSAYGEEVFDGEGNPLPPNHVYDYGVRNDYRYVHVDLDANGEGMFVVKLTIDLSAFEEGDKNFYPSAAAADYGSTINAHLQPWSEDFNIATTSGWEVRPFGAPLSSSPPPETIPLSELGIPEPASGLVMAAGLAVLSAVRARRTRFAS